jgi:3-isopropylmalate dehydrogenase
VFKIGVIAGDGVGPEVVHEGLETLKLVAGKCGFGIETIPFDLGGDRYLRTGEVLPAAEKDAVRKCDAVILGAVGTPKVPPGVLERGLLLDLRFSFRQCVNLRPIKLYPGVDTPLKHATPEKIDMVVVRENNEDLYVGAGGFTYKGMPEEVAIQTSINTRFGVDRVLKYAFELASKRASGRVFPGLTEAEKSAGKTGRVTLVAKTNVLTFAHDLWQRAYNEMAEQYPEIATDYNHVDACCMHMIRVPERYDVIVTTNMFGDIITDLGAVLQGGLGVAGSGNINPDKDFPSMFEPVHGSAPDIAGKGIANPIATCLTVGMMLDHLGEARAAELVRRAVAKVLADGKVKTPDLGGKDSTRAVGEAVRQAIADIS